MATSRQTASVIITRGEKDFHILFLDALAIGMTAVGASACHRPAAVDQRADRAPMTVGRLSPASGDRHRLGEALVRSWAGSLVRAGALLLALIFVAYQMPRLLIDWANIRVLRVTVITGTANVR